MLPIPPFRGIRNNYWPVHSETVKSSQIFELPQNSTNQTSMKASNTLSPIILEVENGCIWKVTTGGDPFFTSMNWRKGSQISKFRLKRLGVSILHLTIENQEALAEIVDVELKNQFSFFQPMMLWILHIFLQSHFFSLLPMLNSTSADLLFLQKNAHMLLLMATSWGRLVVEISLF